MSQQTAKKNLFASAKKVESNKDNKNKAHIIPIPPELEPHVKDFVKAKDEIKNWDAKQKMSEGAIKEKVPELYLAEYKKLRRHIGSFMLGPLMVSVQDRYPTLTDVVAPVVKENFPDVVETKKQYLINQELVEKYGEKISDALLKAEGIPEEDLANLFSVEEVTIVKKGTIETLANYGDQMTELFHAISPIISLRVSGK
jgi:hypothetical protein